MVEWSRSFGGTGVEEPRAALEVNGTGFLFVGTTTSVDGDFTANHGERDGVAIMLGQDGNTLWQRVIGGGAFPGMPGTGDDLLLHAAPTEDGGFLLFGGSNSYGGDISDTTNYGSAPVPWIVKLNAEGQVLWDKKNPEGYSATSSNVVKDNSGLFVTASAFPPSYLVLRKMTEQGELVSQEDYVNTPPMSNTSLIPTQDGGYLIAGEQHIIANNVLTKGLGIVKAAGNGEMEWQKTFSGSSSEGLIRAVESDNGDLIISCTSASDDGDFSGSFGLNDAWIFRLSPQGSLIWQKHFGGSGQDAVTTIHRAGPDTYLLAGETESTDGHFSAPHGKSDIWVAEMAGDGTLNWVDYFGGTEYERLTTVVPADSSLMLFAQSTSSNLDVLGNQGGADLWMTKLAPASTTATTRARQVRPALHLFPVPARTRLWARVQNLNFTKPVELLVSDPAGKLLFQLEMNGPVQEIGLEGLPQGPLAISLVQDGSIITTKKILKVP